MRAATYSQNKNLASQPVVLATLLGLVTFAYLMSKVPEISNGLIAGSIGGMGDVGRGSLRAISQKSSPSQK